MSQIGLQSAPDTRRGSNVHMKCLLKRLSYTGQQAFLSSHYVKDRNIDYVDGPNTIRIQPRHKTDR